MLTKENPTTPHLAEIREPKSNCKGTLVTADNHLPCCALLLGNVQTVRMTSLKTLGGRGYCYLVLQRESPELREVVELAKVHTAGKLLESCDS